MRYHPTRLERGDRVDTHTIAAIWGVETTELRPGRGRNRAPALDADVACVGADRPISRIESLTRRRSSSAVNIKPEKPVGRGGGLRPD